MPAEKKEKEMKGKKLNKKKLSNVRKTVTWEFQFENSSDSSIEYLTPFQSKKQTKNIYRITQNIFTEQNNLNRVESGEIGN